MDLDVQEVVDGGTTLQGTEVEPPSSYTVVRSTTSENRRRQSRGEFFDALRTLGAQFSPLSLNPRSRTGSGRQAYMVFVSCPRDAWVRAFGEPQQVTEHYDLLMHIPFHAWQQPSPNGPVTCTGHLFERSPGCNWVTVARVIF